MGTFTLTTCSGDNSKILAFRSLSVSVTTVTKTNKEGKSLQRRHSNKTDSGSNPYPLHLKLSLYTPLQHNYTRLHLRAPLQAPKYFFQFLLGAGLLAS